MAPSPFSAQIDEVMSRLARSGFRSRFHLSSRERAYLNEKGMAVIQRHAYDFIAQRLAPAQPKNDGRQTPMRGHPVFIAQHATATCCRGCLSKWHGMPAGHLLDEEAQTYIVAVISTWIEQQAA